MYLCTVTVDTVMDMVDADMDMVDADMELELE